MEWITCIREAIAFIEENLQNNISVKDVAYHIQLSEFFFIRGFTSMAGIGPGEYLRNRKLNQAALDLQKSADPITAIAERYGYNSPQSFSRAFTFFHKATPFQIRNGKPYVNYPPLKITLTIDGVNGIDFKIKHLFGFKVTGFQRIFNYDSAYTEIPKFWEEIYNKHSERVYSGKEPSNSFEKAIVDNSIGEYGICIDDVGEDKFRYLIAGKYAGGEVPVGMTVYNLPRGDWAIFECVGPMPDALQSVNTKVFCEWLPGNPDFELNGFASVEWYDIVHGDISDPDYRSAIWVPVKRKKRTNERTPD